MTENITKTTEDNPPYELDHERESCMISTERLFRIRRTVAHTALNSEGVQASLNLAVKQMVDRQREQQSA